MSDNLAGGLWSAKQAREDWSDETPTAHEAFVAWSRAGGQELESAFNAGRASVTPSPSGYVARNQPDGFTLAEWHVEAINDTSEAYTKDRGYLLRCLWCDFYSFAPLHAEALRQMNVHQDAMWEEVENARLALLAVPSTENEAK